MVTFPRPQKLTNEEIVGLYRSGVSQGFLGLKAGIADTRIRAILLAAGVELRSRSERSLLGHATGYRVRRA